MPLNSSRHQAMLPALALAVAVISTPHAHADLDEAPVVGMTVSGGSGWSYWAGNDDGWVANPEPGIFEYGGELSWAECDFSWENELEVDPGLGFGLSITNTQSFTETFSVVLDVQVPGWSNGTLQGASIGGSVSDTNFDGTASLTSSQFLMNTFLDGTSQIELGGGLDVLVSQFAGTDTFGPFSTGLSGGSATIIGPQSTQGNLAIQIDFTLSAGDTASFSGGYLVDYVPAPAGLLALSGLVLARRRRV